MTNWKNKNVLVTGAGGFIGSHLVEELLKLGANVKVFLRYTSSGSIGNLAFLPTKNYELIYGDLRDPFAVKSALTDVDIVFHLASLISIPHSYRNPRDNFDVNVNSILNILEAAKIHGTEQVLHTSTSEVYGTAMYVPIDEKHPLQGQSPYSASKISADMLANSYFLSFDSPVITVRPFNNFGPRQSSRAIIPTIILQALANNKIKLGDTSTTRDFLFVKDTVKGYIKISENFEKIKGETFNLGTGKEFSINDTVNIISKLLDVDIEIVTDQSKIRPNKSEVRRLCCNFDKVNSLIGWKPSYSFEDGLEETIDFYRNYKEKFISNQSFV